MYGERCSPCSTIDGYKLFQSILKNWWQEYKEEMMFSFLMKNASWWILMPISKYSIHCDQFCKVTEKAISALETKWTRYGGKLKRHWAFCGRKVDVSLPNFNITSQSAHIIIGMKNVSPLKVWIWTISYPRVLFSDTNINIRQQWPHLP